MLPPPLPKIPVAQPKKQATLWNEGDDDEEEEDSGWGVKKTTPNLPPPPIPLAQAKKPVASKFFDGGDDDEDDEDFKPVKKPLAKLAMPFPQAKSPAPPVQETRKTNLFDSVVS